jgi:hypothetical protein
MVAIPLSRQYHRVASPGTNHHVSMSNVSMSLCLMSLCLYVSCLCVSCLYVSCLYVACPYKRVGTNPIKNRLPEKERGSACMFLGSRSAKKLGQML